jgi:hypothetical protein
MGFALTTRAFVDWLSSRDTNSSSAGPTRARETSNHVQQNASFCRSEKICRSLSKTALNGALLGEATMFLRTLAAVSRPPATSGAVAPRSQVESAIAGLADRDFAVLQYEAERICRKYREGSV